jgi:hypothetical protein
MSTEKCPLDEREMPEGFQVFGERLEMWGVRFRKDDAAAFANEKKAGLNLNETQKTHTIQTQSKSSVVAKDSLGSSGA